MSITPEQQRMQDARRKVEEAMDREKKMEAANTAEARQQDKQAKKSEAKAASDKVWKPFNDGKKDLIKSAAGYDTWMSSMGAIIDVASKWRDGARHHIPLPSAGAILSGAASLAVKGGKAVVMDAPLLAVKGVASAVVNTPEFVMRHGADFLNRPLTKSAEVIMSPVTVPLAAAGGLVWRAGAGVASLAAGGAAAVSSALGAKEMASFLRGDTLQLPKAMSDGVTCTNGKLTFRSCKDLPGVMDDIVAPLDEAHQALQEAFLADNGWKKGADGAFTNATTHAPLTQSVFNELQRTKMPAYSTGKRVELTDEVNPDPLSSRRPGM